MIFALLLFGNALYEQEELENGWFKRVRRAVTRPFKEVKRAIHHTSTSYEKPPITIGSVTSKKTQDTFVIPGGSSQMEQATTKLQKYGFARNDILMKLKKAALTTRFSFEINRFAMDIHSTNKYMRTSQMQRAIVLGEKVNGALKFNVKWVGANVGVESKIIKKKTGRTLGVKTSSSVHNEFRPLVVSELQQIFDKLQNEVNSKKF